MDVKVQEASDRSASIFVLRELRGVIAEKWNNQSGRMLENIKFAAQIAVEVAIKRHCKDCDKSFQDDEYLNGRIRTILVALYIKVWLMADPTAAQNLHAFYRFGYTKESYRVSRDCTDDNRKCFPFSWQVLVRQYKTMLKVRQYTEEQRQKENRKSEIDQTGTESGSIQQYGKKLSWLTLCEAEKRASGNLQVMTDLMENRMIYHRKSNQESNQYLQKCFQLYYDLFKKLKDATGKDSDMTDIEYVATAITLHEIECSYHFHAAILLAKRFTNYDGDFDCFQEEIALFWGRFAHIDGENQIKYNNNALLEFRLYDILNYQPEIEYLYQKIMHRIEDEKFLKQIRYELIIVNEAYSWLYNIIEREQLKPWSSEDYRFVREFFENEYPISEIWSQGCDEKGNVNLGEIYRKRKRNTGYDNVRKYMIALCTPQKNAYNPESPNRETVSKGGREYKREVRVPKKEGGGRPKKKSQEVVESSL